LLTINVRDFKRFEALRILNPILWGTMSIRQLHFWDRNSMAIGYP